MFRIVVPAALLALAVFAWFMEHATRPEASPAHASATTTPGQAAPGSGGAALPGGTQRQPVPVRVPQLSGEQVDLLAEQLDAALAKLPAGAKSCLVVRELSAVSGELVLGGLYDHNGQWSLVPASNQKIITAAAALMLLGPDYRFTTRVLAARMPNREGTLNGDLYLVGGGDPVLYTADYVAAFARTPTIYTAVEQLAQQVHDRGLRQLLGSIVAVEYRYDSVREASPLLSNYFIGPLSALLLNDGYENYQQRFDLGAEPAIAAEPSQFSAALFDDLLEELGIVITHRPRKATTDDDIGGYIELARLESAPLSELLASLLADSDNTSAELLLKEIATYSNYEAAREAGNYAPTTTTTTAAPVTTASAVQELPSTTEPPFVLTPPEPRGDDLGFGTPGVPTWEAAGQTETTAEPQEPQTTAEPQAPQEPQTTAEPQAPATGATGTNVPATVPGTKGLPVASDFSGPTTSLPEIEDPNENPLLVEPGSTLAGLQQIPAILQANGIDNWVGIPHDGSGLDRGNLLNCTVIADVLDYFGPDSAFADALAVAGERGTLTNVLADTPLEGRLKGKSGSLPGVLALSGFIDAADGRSLTFAWLANFEPDQAEAMHESREELALAMADYLALS